MDRTIRWETEEADQERIKREVARMLYDAVCGGNPAAYLEKARAAAAHQKTTA